jgi:hypothetical protein
MEAAEKTVKITSGKTLRSFLDQVIGEGVKSALAQKAMNEKEKQQAAAGGGGGSDVDSLFGDDEGGTDKPAGDEGGEQPDEQPEAPHASKTMDDETEKLQKSEVKVKDIVEKMNAIRSGKSFKDSAVSKAMDEWIGSLSKTERVALFAFLRGIAQIVTGEIPGKQAEDPGKHPSDVKMDKTNEPHTVHKKPNVIAGPSRDAEPVKNGKAPEEDTRAPTPAPITPKRR